MVKMLMKENLYICNFLANIRYPPGNKTKKMIDKYVFSEFVFDWARLDPSIEDVEINRRKRMKNLDELVD